MDHRSAPGREEEAPSWRVRVWTLSMACRRNDTDMAQMQQRLWQVKWLRLKCGDEAGARAMPPRMSLDMSASQTREARALYNIPLVVGSHVDVNLKPRCRNSVENPENSETSSSIAQVTLGFGNPSVLVLLMRHASRE